MIGKRSAAGPDKAQTFLKQEVVRPEVRTRASSQREVGEDDQHLLRASREMGDQLIQPSEQLCDSVHSGDRHWSTLLRTEHMAGNWAANLCMHRASTPLGETVDQETWVNTKVPVLGAVREQDGRGHGEVIAKQAGTWKKRSSHEDVWGQNILCRYKEP